jgi:hypothetical protein
MKRIQAWFPTFLYCDRLQRGSWQRFNRELLKECHQIRDFDEAGQKWSAKNYPGGFTSYGSMDKLHQFSSTFMDLEQLIDRHVKAYARALEWDLGLHLHPNSVVSGTYYVATPKGCAGLKFEDPRLSKFMAAPPRKAKTKPTNQLFANYPAEAGNVVLFESWMRHEVTANPVESERVSISFNYDWA